MQLENVSQKFASFQADAAMNAQMRVEPGNEIYTEAVKIIKKDVILGLVLDQIKLVLKGSIVLREGRLPQKYGEANVGYIHGEDGFITGLNGVEVVLDNQKNKTVEDYVDTIAHELIEVGLSSELISQARLQMSNMQFLQKVDFYDWIVYQRMYKTLPKLSDTTRAEIGYRYLSIGLKLMKHKDRIRGILADATQVLSEFDHAVAQFEKNWNVKERTLNHFRNEVRRWLKSRGLSDTRFSVKSLSELYRQRLIAWADIYIGPQAIPETGREVVLRDAKAGDEHDLNETNVAERFFQHVEPDKEGLKYLLERWHHRSAQAFAQEMMVAYSKGLFNNFQKDLHRMKQEEMLFAGEDPIKERQSTLNNLLDNILFQLVIIRRYQGFAAMRGGIDLSKVYILADQNHDITKLSGEYEIIDLFKNYIFGWHYLSRPGMNLSRLTAWYAGFAPTLKGLYDHLAPEGMVVLSLPHEEYNNMALVKALRMVGAEERLESYSLLYRDGRFVPSMDMGNYGGYDGQKRREKMFIISKNQLAQLVVMAEKLAGINETYGGEIVWKLFNLTTGIPVFRQRNIGVEILMEQVDITAILKKHQNLDAREEWSHIADEILHLLPNRSADAPVDSPRSRMIKEDIARGSQGGIRSALQLVGISNSHIPAEDIWTIPQLLNIIKDDQQFSFDVRVDALRALAVIGSYFDELRTPIESIVNNFVQNNPGKSWETGVLKQILQTKPYYELQRKHLINFLSQAAFYISSSGSAKIGTGNLQYLGDNAMIARKEPQITVNSTKIKNGGIDLNANEKMLEEQGDKINLPVPSNLPDWQNFQTNGFIPVIINIAPPISLPTLLGMDATKKPSSEPITVSSLN